MFNLFKKKPMSKTSATSGKVALCENRKDKAGNVTAFYIVKTHKTEKSYYFSFTEKRENASLLTPDEVEYAKMQNSKLEEI